MSTSPTSVECLISPQTGYGVHAHANLAFETQTGLILFGKNGSGFTVGDTSHKDHEVRAAMLASFQIGFVPKAFSLSLGIGGYTVYYPANFRFNILPWKQTSETLGPTIDINIQVDIATQYAVLQSLTYSWTAAR